MHSPRPDSSSTNLIVDLVSQFISKMLNQDPHHSQYIKQWNSFRQLLCAVPIDLNSIFSYISNIATTAAATHSPTSPNSKKLSKLTVIESPHVFKDLSHINLSSRNASDFALPIATEGDEPQGEIDFIPQKHRRACSSRHAGAPSGLSILSPIKYALNKNHSSPYKPSGNIDSPRLRIDSMHPSILEDDSLNQTAMNQSYPQISSHSDAIPSPLTPNVMNLDSETPRTSHKALSKLMENFNNPLGTLFQPISSTVSGVSKYNLSFLSGISKKFRGNFEKNSEAVINTRVTKNKVAEGSAAVRIEEFKGERHSELRKMTLFDDKRDGRQLLGQQPRQLQIPQLQQPTQLQQQRPLDIHVPVYTLANTPVYTEMKYNDFKLQKEPSYRVDSKMTGNWNIRY